MPQREGLQKFRKKRERNMNSGVTTAQVPEGGGTRRISPHPACPAKSANESAQLRTVGRFELVVEYSTTTNAHPEGVRRVVLKTPPNEEVRGHPRFRADFLTSQGKLPVLRVSREPVRRTTQLIEPNSILKIQENGLRRFDQHAHRPLRQTARRQQHPG